MGWGGGKFASWTLGGMDAPLYHAKSSPYPRVLGNLRTHVTRTMYIRTV